MTWMHLSLSILSAMQENYYLPAGQWYGDNELILKETVTCHLVSTPSTDYHGDDDDRGKGPSVS